MSHREGAAVAVVRLRGHIHPFSFPYHHHWVEGLHSPLAYSLSNMRLSNDPSVFDIVNLFRLRWFLNRDWLLSFVASAQRSESGRIEWVEFLPDGHVHLVCSAFKLVPPTPSVPAAKIKRCMFAFIIEFLNRERLYADFFAPSPPRKARKRVRKSQDTSPPPPAEGQAVDAMALDVEDQDPASAAPLSLQPPLELVRGTPSGASTTSAPAAIKRKPPGLAEALMEAPVRTSTSPLPSLTPSPSAVQPALRTYVEPAGQSIGLFRTPKPLAGQKHALTPSPPSLPLAVVLPTSPPPPVGTKVGYKKLVAPDWRDWIRARQLAARQQDGVVTQEDLNVAVALASSPPPP